MSTPAVQRSRRLRWVALVGLTLPLVELLVLIAVGEAIGAWRTLLLLVVISLVGVAVLRREGPVMWRRLRETARAGGAPTREVADGALVLIGGVLLVLPGLVSDALALVCILPVTRALPRRALMAWVERSVRRLPTPPRGWGQEGSGTGTGRGGVVQGEVVQGEVVDRDPHDPDESR